MVFGKKQPKKFVFSESVGDSVDGYGISQQVEDNMKHLSLSNHTLVFSGNLVFIIQSTPTGS